MTRKLAQRRNCGSNTKGDSNAGFQLQLRAPSDTGTSIVSTYRTSHIGILQNNNNTQLLDLRFPVEHDFCCLMFCREIKSAVHAAATLPKCATVCGVVTYVGFHEFGVESQEQMAGISTRQRLVHDKLQLGHHKLMLHMSRKHGTEHALTCTGGCFAVTASTPRA